MDINHDDAADFFSMFESEIRESEPMTAADLARVSIDSNAGEHPLARTHRSSGTLRFTGNVIDGHEGEAVMLFEAGSAFARLVTSIGSALKGSHTKISDDARRLTQLNLNASPLPGSVIFSLVADIEPREELRGQGETIDADRPLIDRSIDVAKSLLSLRGPSAGDTLAEQLQQLGPISASAFKGFVKATGAEHLNAHFSWNEPLRASSKWKLDASDAAYLLKIVEGRHLDEVQVELTGVLKTVSSNEPWVISENERGSLHVNMSELPGAPWLNFRPTDTVTIIAQMKPREMPGQKIQYTYRCLNIFKHAE